MVCRTYIVGCGIQSFIIWSLAHLLPPFPDPASRVSKAQLVLLLAQATFSPPQFFRCQPGHLPATTVSEARETLSCAQLGAHVPRNNPLWSTLTKSHTFIVLRDRLPSCPSFHSLTSKRAMSYVMANENLLQAHFSIIKHIK